MWFLIAFALSLLVPLNGIIISLFYGTLGRFYIIFVFIAYNKECCDLFVKLIETVKGVL